MVLDSFENEKNRLEQFFNKGNEENDEITTKFQKSFEEKDEFKNISQIFSHKIGDHQNFINYVKKNEILFKKMEKQNQKKNSRKKSNSFQKQKKNLIEAAFFYLNFKTINLLKKIINSKYYQNSVYFCISLGIINIIISSFTYENYNKYLYWTMEIIDLFIYCFFIFEICLKLALNGIIIGKFAYFKKNAF